MTIYAIMYGPEQRVGSLAFTDSEGNVSQWNHWDGPFDSTAPAHAAITAAYAAGAAVVFVDGQVDGRYFAETPALADPDHATLPTLEPLPWMMRENPLNPRSTIWPSLEIDGWNNLPAEGEENVDYVVSAGGKKHILRWDSATSSYRQPSTDRPSYTTAVFAPPDAGDTISFYSESGSSAGSSLAHSRVDLEAVSARSSIPTADLAWSDANDWINAVAAMPVAVKVALSGTAAGGSTDAVWETGGVVSTGQPDNYAFQAQLIRLRGSDATVLAAEAKSGIIVYSTSPPAIENVWNVEFPLVHTDLQAGDKLYVSFGTNGAAPSTNPRSKSITVTGGSVTVNRYATDEEAAVAAENTDALAPILIADAEVTEYFVHFDEPVPLDDYPNLEFDVRLQRSGANFKQTARISLRGYEIGWAAIGDVVSNPDEASLSRISCAYDLDTGGRAKPFAWRGEGWGWETTTQTHYQVKLYPWGDNGVLRGARMDVYYSQPTETTLGVEVRFAK